MIVKYLTAYSQPSLFLFPVEYVFLLPCLLTVVFIVLI